MYFKNHFSFLWPKVNSPSILFIHMIQFWSQILNHSKNDFFFLLTFGSVISLTTLPRNSMKPIPLINHNQIKLSPTIKCKMNSQKQKIQNQHFINNILLILMYKCGAIRFYFILFLNLGSLFN